MELQNLLDPVHGELDNFYAPSIPRNTWDTVFLYYLYTRIGIKGNAWVGLC